MKQPINEIKRMQQLAGLIIENEGENIYAPEPISDIGKTINDYFKRANDDEGWGFKVVDPQIVSDENNNFAMDNSSDHFEKKLAKKIIEMSTPEILNDYNEWKKEATKIVTNLKNKGLEVF